MAYVSATSCAVVTAVGFKRLLSKVSVLVALIDRKLSLLVPRNYWQYNWMLFRDLSYYIVQMGDKIGSVLMLRKSLAERKMGFFGYIVRKTAWKRDWYTGRWKASGKGAYPQRPGSRIYNTGQRWTWQMRHKWHRSGKMAGNYRES